MSREEAINKWIIPAIKNTWNEKKCNEILKALEQEPKTGHWIEENKGLFGIYPRCSKCNELYHTKEKYCPNCGTKMESGD